MKTISNWYEVHADDEPVASFGPISREASDKAFKLVEDTMTDLYKDKVLKIIAVWLPADGVDPVMTEVIHESHPTVIEAWPLGN